MACPVFSTRAHSAGCMWCFGCEFERRSPISNATLHQRRLVVVIVSLLAGLLPLLTLNRPALAADMSLYFYSAVLQYGIVFPPDRWVPVRMEFVNRTDAPVEGFGKMDVNNAAGGVVFQVPAFVPAHSRVAVTGYGYFPETPYGLGNVPADRVPPITIAEWRAAGGNWLARSEILARRVSSTPDGSNAQAGMPQTLLMAISNRSGSEDRDSYDPIGFSNAVTSTWGSWMAATSGVNETNMPREAFGYDSCQAVMLDATDADLLDLAQRRTLIEYIRGGGILIVTAPLDEADLAGSWLADYSPVNVVGRRQANHIDVAGQTDPLPLREWVEIAEAIEAGGADDRVLVRDGDYVHAAYRPVGRGRVIFTSFPINALDAGDDRSTALWMDMLQLNAPQSSWHYSDLALKREELLQSMMGLPAPPWILAATVAGGYVVAVLLLQTFIGGARRPGAFMTAVVVAVLLSGGLLVANQYLRRDQSLAGARIALIELGEGGGGVQHEAFAYAGEDDSDFVITTENRDTTLRPIRTVAPPTIIERPFHANAAVHKGKIGSIWQSGAPVAGDFRIDARGQFGPAGLEVTVQNQAGHEFQSPLLLWGARSFSLPAFPAGEGKAVASGSNRNLRGDYKNASVFTSASTSLRGEILQAALKETNRMYIGQQTEANPELAGWLSEAGTPMLVKTSAPTPPPVQTQTLVRTPLRIVPSEIGATVSIDAGFNRLVIPMPAGLPYQSGQDTWIESTQNGQWLIGFAPPSGIGQLRARKATLQFDINAPQQKLTIRRGQCASEGNVPSVNPNGAVVGEWNNPVSGQSLTIDCAPEDTDENGWLWLLVSIDSSPIGSGVGQGLLPRWKFEELSVSYESEVIGPPPRHSTTPATPSETTTAE